MIDEDLNEKFYINEFKALMFKAMNNDQYFLIVNMIIDFDEIKTFIIKDHRM